MFHFVADEFQSKAAQAQQNPYVTFLGIYNQHQSLSGSLVTCISNLGLVTHYFGCVQETSLP